MAAVRFKPCSKCGALVFQHTQDPCSQCASDAAWVAAIAVAQHGGVCNCTDENALFKVALRDGRFFNYASIHGSGGPIRGKDACERAVLQLTQRETIRLYLAWRWWGEWYVDIRVGDVLGIALAPERGR